MAHRPKITLIQLENVLSNALEDTANVPEDLVIPILELIDLIQAIRCEGGGVSIPHDLARHLGTDNDDDPTTRILH